MVPSGPKAWKRLRASCTYMCNIDLILVLFLLLYRVIRAPVRARAVRLEHHQPHEWSGPGWVGDGVSTWGFVQCLDTVGCWREGRPLSENIPLRFSSGTFGKNAEAEQAKPGRGAVAIFNVCAEFAPIASPSAAERFSSPAAGTGAKRRLFDSGEGTAASNSTSRRGVTASDSASQAVPIPMVLVADKKGRQVTLCCPLFACKWYSADVLIRK